MTFLRWVHRRLTVIAWDVPLTGTWGRRVWSGQWSPTGRRWVRV